jgi:hypothetical protein
VFRGHLSLAARIITRTALRIASGICGQASVISRREVSIASDFAARRDGI